MADQIYRVLTVYDVDSGRATQGVTSLISAFDHLLNVMDRVKGLMTSVMTLHAEAETSRIAIAGMFSAAGMEGASSFQRSLQMSSEMIAKMRKDARDLPGTFEDLQNIFQMGILGGGQAGKSVDQIEKMSADLMAVSKALNINSESAGREFAAMMEGRAGSHNILFQRLRGVMGPGMDAQQFNQMAAPEKWQAIEKALSKFGPMIAEYANSWDAVSSTTEDYARTIERVATSAFFKEMKGTLQSINRWYEDNEDKINAFAKSFGEKLGAGFKYIKDIFAWIMEHKDMLLPMVTALGGAVASGAGGLLGAGMGGTGNEFAMVKGAALEVALAKVTTNLSDMSPALDHFRLGLAGVEGAMSQLNGPIGDVVKLLKMFHRGLEWAFNKLDEGAQERRNKEATTEAFKSNFALGQVHNRAAVLQYMKEWEVFDQYGNVKKHGAGSIADKLAARTTLDPAEAETHQIYTALKNLIESMTPAEISKVRKKHFWEMGEGYGPGDTPYMLQRAEKPGTPKNNNLNVAVKIEQEINTEGDPDRLLIATRKAMQEALHRPLTTFRKNIIGS